MNQSQKIQPFNPPSPQRGFGGVNPILILFLPATVVFDIISYLYSRSTCFECTGISEFVRDSSLTKHILFQTYAILRGNKSSIDDKI